MSLLLASGPLNRHKCYDCPLRGGRATRFDRRGCSRQASSTLVEYGGTASGGRDVSALAIPHSSGSAWGQARGGGCRSGEETAGLDWPGKHATGVPRQHTLGQLWVWRLTPPEKALRGLPRRQGWGVVAG